MIRLFRWLRHRRSIGQVESHLNNLEKKLAKIKKEKDEIRKDLNEELSSFRVLRGKLDEQAKLIEKKFENNYQLGKKYEEALNAVEEELRTARELTIPGLVASHQVLINRWDAEVAVSARKAAAASLSTTE